MSVDFQGKRVVVIGGSAGIGLAASSLIAENGGEVVIAGRDRVRLDRALDLIGHGAVGHQLDVRNPDDIVGFYDRIGTFDHLATPAAGGTLGLFMENDPNEVRDLIESKLWGQYWSVRHAVPHLRADGSITLFSGIVSRKPLPGGSAYAMVAGAVESLTRCLALELQPLRVNCVTPGVVETDIWTELLDAEAAAEHLRTTGTMLPVGRAGKPEEVALAVAYCMVNEFANGSIIDVDGGHRAI